MVQAVVERLEAEAADNRQAARQEAEERETALKGRYQAALQAAQDSELKHAERSVPVHAALDCVLDLLRNFDFSSVFSLAGNTCSNNAYMTVTFAPRLAHAIFTMREGGFLLHQF